MDDEFAAILRLDLRDWLELQEGYQLDVAESTKDSFKMRKGSDVLIVRQREQDGIWEYFNTQDTKDNGTIVAYLQRRRGGKGVFTVGHVRNALRGYTLRLGAVSPRLPRPVAIRAPRDLSQVAERWLKFQPVVSLPPYLAARGLSADTVLAYASALRVDKKGNVLFAHTNGDNQIVGYEIANEALHAFSKGGVRLLCRLGQIEGQEPAKIAITESGIDALSLAQIVRRKDTLFLSTGGTLSAYTVQQIKLLADKYPHAEILPAFDNDKGGEDFTATVERALHGRGNVRRVIPKQDFKDWNDQLLGKKTISPALG